MKFLWLWLILIFAGCNTEPQVVDFSVDKILKVQKKLKEKGYEVSLSGEVDSLTRRALLQFQKDNSLSSHHPLETVQALFDDD